MRSSRLIRPLALSLLASMMLALVGGFAVPLSGVTVQASSIPLFTAASSKSVPAGAEQKIWVHTIALAQVRLQVEYTTGQSITIDGSTDQAGVHQFQWTPSYVGSKATLAHYWVYVTRDSLSTSARGDFTVFPSDLRLQVLTERLQSNTPLRLRVHSHPEATLTVLISTSNGNRLFTQTARADKQGDLFVTATVDTSLAQGHPLRIIVSGDFGGHRSSTSSTVPLSSVPVALQPQSPAHAILVHPRSVKSARSQARKAAAGSLAQAQQNAQAAVQAIVVDIQTLAQWSSAPTTHSEGYYQALLASASSYDSYINVTAQALADDAAVQSLMHQAMPHKAIMVSLHEQYLRAYEDGHLVQSSPVTTGRPALPTVTGHFAIYEKITPFEFHSPWPIGSPYYYAPTWIKYWMPFYGGYGLHDASWRARYGPGTNVYGDGAGSAEPTGSHGCVNIPFATTQWIWDWAPLGTPVVVYGGPHVQGGAAGI